MSRTAVILSGGLGMRLRPFTSIIPKPLLPIGEKAVLEIQIERLVEHGFTTIILATNYMADYIENFLGHGERYGAAIHVSRETKPLGTAGPLKLVEDRLTEPFLVMNGDILCLTDFGAMYDFAVSRGALLTVGLKERILPFAYGNVFFSGDRVTGIQEKPDFRTFAMAGIYIMDPRALAQIPDDEYFGMDLLIESMLATNLEVLKYEIAEYWLDIGNVDDYEKAQAEYGSSTHGTS